MSTEKNNRKIDWETVEIIVVEVSKLNPQNPYSNLSEQQRQSQLEKLYRQILAERNSQMD